MPETGRGTPNSHRYKPSSTPQHRQTSKAYNKGVFILTALPEHFQNFIRFLDRDGLVFGKNETSLLNDPLKKLSSTVSI